MNKVENQPEIYPRTSHPISRKLIDEDALRIMYRLLRHGFKAYVVGGGVRDLLLGKNPKDFDIATDATPNQVKKLFRNSRIIGKRFKLVHIFFARGKYIEVATFRDATVPIGTQEEADLSVVKRDNTFGTEGTDAIRRDLTINGLFYDLSNFSIIDYVGGMKDLTSRTIRIIGDPVVRYAEDPIRVLRVLRHAARSGFSVEEETWKELLVAKSKILACPQMRIFEEFRKDLLSGCLGPVLSYWADGGVLEILLPELLSYKQKLKDPSSFICNVLLRIDRLMTEDSLDIPSHIVLSALHLLPLAELRLGDTEAFNAYCATLSRKQLQLQVEQAFQKIFIPRRERELMALLSVQTIVGNEGGRQSSQLIKDAELLREILALPENGFLNLPEEREDEVRKKTKKRRRKKKPLPKTENVDT